MTTESQQNTISSSPAPACRTSGHVSSQTPPAEPDPVVISDRAVRVIVWIAALILLLPVMIFLYVFFIRNRLLMG